MATTDHPYINTDGDLTLGHGHQVWTDDHGGLHGIARLGAVRITFHDPVQVRELIAYLALLAADMDAEAASGDEDDGEDGDDDPDALTDERVPSRPAAWDAAWGMS